VLLKNPESIQGFLVTIQSVYGHNPTATNREVHSSFKVAGTNRVFIRNKREDEVGGGGNICDIKYLRDKSRMAVIQSEAPVGDRERLTEAYIGELDKRYKVLQSYFETKFQERIHKECDNN
jgi:hypothetical protein